MIVTPNEKYDKISDTVIAPRALIVLVLLALPYFGGFFDASSEVSSLSFRSNRRSTFLSRSIYHISLALNGPTTSDCGRNVRIPETHLIFQNYETNTSCVRIPRNALHSEVKKTFHSYSRIQHTNTGVTSLPACDKQRDTLATDICIW